MSSNIIKLLEEMGKNNCSLKKINNTFWVVEKIPTRYDNNLYTVVSTSINILYALHTAKDNDWKCPMEVEK